MDLQNERQVDTVLAQAWAQKEKGQFEYFDKFVMI